MKKNTFWIIVGVILFVFILPFKGITQSNLDIDNFFNSLLGGLGSVDTSFGFSSTTTPTISEQTDSTVKISFPVVTKGTEKIKKYEVNASSISVADFSNPNIDYDKVDFKIAEFVYTDTEVLSGTLSATITGLDLVTKRYYIAVTPISSTNTRGNATREVVVGNGSSPTTSSPTTSSTIGTHNAGPDMTMANVSYIQDGLKIILTWTPLQGADEVEVYYGKIGSTLVSAGVASMNDGKYTFTVPEVNTYIVKLQPRNNGASVGTEMRLTVHMLGGSSSTTPTTTTTTTTTTTIHNNIPPTGPEDYILPILGISLIVYFFYRYRQN